MKCARCLNTIESHDHAFCGYCWGSLTTVAAEKIKTEREDSINTERELREALRIERKTIGAQEAEIARLQKMVRLGHPVCCACGEPIIGEAFWHVDCARKADAK